MTRQMKAILFFAFVLSGACLATDLKPTLEVPTPEPPTKSALTDDDLLQAIEALDTMDVEIAADPAGPHKAQASDKSNPAQGPTVITASDTEFNQAEHKAVFQNKVELVNSTINMLCDKLTAYMRNHEGKGAAAQPAAPAPAVRARGNKFALATVPDGGGALEKAVGEGSVAVMQDKVDESGKLQRTIGHGKKVVYDALSGKVTLTGNPDMAQGDNLCVSLDESTVIVLRKDGHMEVSGPHKTVIRESPPEKQGAAK